MILSEITIVIKNTDGSTSTVHDIVPHHVANEINISLIEWKHHWSSTFKQTEEYLNALKEYDEKQ